MIVIDKEPIKHPKGNGLNKFLTALYRLEVYGSQEDYDILEQACITAYEKRK